MRQESSWRSLSGRVVRPETWTDEQETPALPSGRGAVSRLAQGKDASRPRREPVPAPLVLVAVLLTVVPMILVPTTDAQWHGAKNAAVEVGAVCLLAFGLWRVRLHDDRRWAWETLRRGLAPPLLGLLGWATLSLAWAPDRALAVEGLLRLGSGIVIALTVAAQCRTDRDLRLVLGGLSGATLAACLIGLDQFGSAKSGVWLLGPFDDHQLMGSFLMLMLPLMLMIGAAPVSLAERYAAAAAAALDAVTLLLTLNRSSWIGTVAAAAVLAAGTAFYIRPKAPSRRQGWLAVLWAALTLGLLGAGVGVSRLSEPLLKRVQSLARTDTDSSFQWRRVTWRGTLHMIAARPLTGWGVGCDVLLRDSYTHEGNPQAEVAAHGAALNDQAHDLYLQTASALGLPGLALWLGVLVTAFRTGGQALARLDPNGLRGRLLLGVIAALAAQVVDALANPAWQYGEAALYLWVCLGLILTLSAPAVPVQTVRDPSRAEGRPAQTLCLVGVVLISTTLLWLIVRALPIMPSAHL